MNKVVSETETALCSTCLACIFKSSMILIYPYHTSLEALCKCYVGSENVLAVPQQYVAYSG
jgi:hypothetical protein